MTKTRIRRGENRSLKLKTMTKSILSFVDETRRDEKIGGWLTQGFPNFSARDPQNNGARDWRPPPTLNVVYNVAHSQAHALLGLYKHGH